MNDKGHPPQGADVSLAQVAYRQVIASPEELQQRHPSGRAAPRREWLCQLVLVKREKCGNSALATAADLPCCTVPESPGSGSVHFPAPTSSARAGSPGRPRRMRHFSDKSENEACPGRRRGCLGTAPIPGSHWHQSPPLILATCLEGEEGVCSLGRDGAYSGRCSDLPKSHSSLSSGSPRAQDLSPLKRSRPGVAASV